MGRETPRLRGGSSHCFNPGTPCRAIFIPSINTAYSKHPSWDHIGLLRRITARFTSSAAPFTFERREKEKAKINRREGKWRLAKSLPTIPRLVPVSLVASNGDENSTRP